MVRKIEKKSGRQASLEGIGEIRVSRKSRVRQGHTAGRKPQVEVQYATGLLCSLSAGVCIFDKYGVITFCNGRFAELAGQTVRKLVGRKLRKNALWGLWGQPDEFRVLFSKAKESRQALTMRAMPVNKGGIRYWDLELKPHISRKKKYEGMSLLVEDVTRSLEKENARELLNRYYVAALLQTSPQALLEESVRLLSEFSGCPSVQILVLDPYKGGVVKAASERSPGLWDSGHTVTQAFIESLFHLPQNGTDLYRKDNGSIYLADVSALESQLSGNLKELVAAAGNSYGFNSLALIPVRLEEQEAGYIQLASTRANGITKETVEAVESIAGHLQVVLEHTGLKDELRRQRQSLLKQIYERSAHLESLGERLKQEVFERKKAQEEMRVQRDLAISLNGIESMDEALNLCLDMAITVSGMDSGGIYLADPVAGGFKLVCARGLSEDFVKLVSYHSAAERGGKLVMGGKSLFGRYGELDTASDDLRRKEGLKGIGIVPIIHGLKTVACLSIASHVFEEIPVNARNAVEAISAVLGTFIAHISGREELIESEERYRTLFARTTNPIMVIDSEGNYIDGNDAALAFLECAREEFLGMNVRDTLPPYLDEEWFDRLRKMWEIGGTVERDYYVWGKIKVLELTIIPLQVAGRKIIFGIGKDITERKIAEAALRESQEQYRSLIENAGEAIFIVQDAKIKFANKRSFEFVQYSHEELTSRPFSEFVYPPDMPMVLERYTARLSGQSVESMYPFRFVDKDCSVKWVEMRATPVLWDNRAATLTLMTDITGRRQAEEAQQESETRYRLLADNSLDVIWTADMKLEINYVSPSILQHTGYAPEEVIDSLQQDPMNAVKLGWSEEDVERRMACLRTLVREKAGKQMLEYQMGHRDGSIHWVEETLSIMRDREGEPTGVLGVMRDISEQKKIIEQLISADRLVSMGEMAAGLAHQVNNPLTTVMGFAYLLQQNPATPEVIKEDIEAIYEESRRASEVLQNFLLFTRGQQTEKIVIQINDVVEAALSLRQSRLELENIKVDKHLAEGLPSIKGNAAQLQQALVNIVLNAEHFMYQAHQRGTLEVTTTVSGANVKVIINDDGPGIAPDKLGRVFEPFYSTRESGEGTGLGLSVCHGIIKEHGGNIYAESAPGRGATFTVELPAGQQGFILA